MSSAGGAYCLVIGAMKAGTTSVYEYLTASDEVSPSREKDTMFFVAPRDGGNWHRGLAWYESRFTGTCGLRVEASTQYSKWPDKQGVPERILRSIGPPWLVYAVRHPVDRAISHYFHNLLNEGVKSDINEALGDESSKYYNYSDYGLQLEQYLSIFSANRLLLVEPTRVEKREHQQRTLIEALGISEPRREFPRANGLRENLLHGGGSGASDLSPVTIRALETLRSLVSRGVPPEPVPLALGFGLRRIVHEKLWSVLRERSIAFSRLTRYCVRHWWATG